MKDGMKYEKTGRKQSRLDKKQAKDILSTRDNKVLEQMRSFTIVRFLYKRHSTGIWIVVACVSWVCRFVFYLT